MMKKIFSFIILLSYFSISSCNAQTEHEKYDPNGIHWMSFEQAVALNDKAPKKIFIDTYTQWCGWCKRMDASTFKDTAVVRYMNDHFYAVKLDAETKDTIRFKGKEFVYKSEYKSNELALSLLQGKMSYPSFIFMDEKYQLLTPLPGYQTPEQLIPILKYFGEDIYKTKKWEEYVGQ
jgi:thioredoxin-related protein